MSKNHKNTIYLSLEKPIVKSILQAMILIETTYFTPKSTFWELCSPNAALVWNVIAQNEPVEISCSQSLTQGETIVRYTYNKI